jgi:hypothetical protein
MFKAHSEYPLHLAIQHQREDVVFLFLIEFNSQVRNAGLVLCYTEGGAKLKLHVKLYQFAQNTPFIHVRTCKHL